MQRRRLPSPRAGFTLTEMMIAMTLTVIVFGVAVTFFRSQVIAMDKQAGHSDAVRNAAYGVSQIDKDLRNAGANLPGSGTQPMIVRAASDAITFNGDLVTARQGDLRAVYYDKEVDSAAVTALGKHTRITLPNGGPQYPDTVYGGTAETTSYFVRPDTTRGGSGLYMLMRQVNRLAPELVAKNIDVPAGEHPFRYFKSDSVGGLKEIPADSLPLFHSAPIHESALDVGRSALTDSIKLVRVRLIGVYKNPRGGEVRDTVERSIRIMNAGLLHLSQCGAEPVLSTSVGAAKLGGPGRRVVITWFPSTDELGGEQDIEMYAVFRRAATSPDFSEPLATVQASSASIYTYLDDNVPNGSWVYGVAAQDCTPNNSLTRTSAAVTFP